MAMLSDVRSVLANSTVQNAFAGKTNEFFTSQSLARFGIVASAVGIFVTILLGNEVLVEDQEVSGANRFPIDPDDFFVEGIGLINERMVVKLRNSTAGPLTVNSVAKVTEL